MNRVEIVQNTLNQYLASAPAAGQRLDRTARLSPESGLTVQQALEIFEDQVTSRLLDVASRELKKRNQGFYTISSAGHENNAIVGTLLRLDDPCFLHYRSGGLMMARARKLSESDPIFETLLSFCASADEPIAQGRHKVWGSFPLWVPPQTSTIASHLPKAAGLAFALRQALRAGRRLELPELSADSIVCCSFGDASANHATALAGINAARYAMRRGGSAPILFICEDNGIGISVETPSGWIRDSFSHLPHLTYFEASGTMDEIWKVTAEAIDTCRHRRAPVFLHLHVTRLWGHAGTDVETTYRTLEEIVLAESRDPLLLNARRLIETGAAVPAELRARVEQIQGRIDNLLEEAVRRPQLSTVEQIVASLAPYDEAEIRKTALVAAAREAREKLFDESLP
ncbi:MAG TPA: thiamine pyrophosphate-dependent enzyme, partial [Blastocatellia bacterium]|nr:thiamine pyrophosphate-dependent enzyme [Blastocatellia bacterium]